MNFYENQIKVIGSMQQMWIDTFLTQIELAAPITRVPAELAGVYWITAQSLQHDLHVETEESSTSTLEAVAPKIVAPKTSEEKPLTSKAPVEPKTVAPKPKSTPAPKVKAEPQAKVTAPKPVKVKAATPVTNPAKPIKASTPVAKVVAKPAPAAKAPKVVVSAVKPTPASTKTALKAKGNTAPAHAATPKPALAGVADIRVKSKGAKPTAASQKPKATAPKKADYSK